MALIKPRHFKLYKKYTELLVSDLSKDITLRMEGESSFCNNCLYDHRNKCSTGRYNGTGPSSFSGGICPVCNGKGKITTETEKIIKGIAKWVPPGEKDEDNKLVSAGTVRVGYFKIKSLIANFDDIKNAKKIVIDGIETTLINIIPRGLKENVVLLAYTTIDED